MSYTPIKTITRSGTQLIENTDLTPLLSTFVGTHSYLVVKNGYGINYVLSLTSIFNFVRNLDKTQPISTGLNSLLTDLFVQQYNATDIPVIENERGYYTNRIRVLNPISYSGYSVSFTSLNTPSVVDEPNQRGTLDDLVITSTQDSLENALVAVNGVFHKTLYSNGSLYVLDGFRTMRISNSTDVCLVDTSRIGGHTIVPLTTSNVTQTTYNDWAYITLPSALSNQTACIVIDGYWYHLDSDALWIIDSTHIGIRTNILPLIQQFRHNPRTMYRKDRFGTGASQYSTKYSDPYEILFLSENYIPSSTLESLAFQYSRVTAYHSFLVLFNKEEIFTVNRSVFPTGVPRFYYDYTTLPLSGLMSYGCGLSPSYLIHKETSIHRQIFISGQDNDRDLQDYSYNPSFIPALIPQPNQAKDIPVSFTDYVSA